MTCSRSCFSVGGEQIKSSWPLRPRKKKFSEYANLLILLKMTEFIYINGYSFDVPGIRYAFTSLPNCSIHKAWDPVALDFITSGSNVSLNKIYSILINAEYFSYFFTQRYHTQNMIKYLSKLCLNSNIPAMILAMYLFIASTFPSKFWRGKTHPGEELTGRGSMLFKYISSSHHLYA